MLSNSAIRKPKSAQSDKKEYCLLIFKSLDVYSLCLSETAWTRSDHSKPVNWKSKSSDLGSVSIESLSRCL